MLYDANHPLTLEAIQADPDLHDRLVKLAKKRFFASSQYVKPWHERWVRFYKIYRTIVDAVDDPDEANYGIGYAFGIVEDLVSTISEPILQMKPPCRVAAKRAGHEQQADNFAAVVSTYFGTSRYQLEWTESVREMIIIGNSWEFDGWADDYAPGRRWAKVPRETLIDKIRGATGKIFNMAPSPTSYESIEEVDHQTPLKTGYFTRFPWAFDVFPEPGMKNVRDMHWVLEQERSVAIADLERRTYVDPATGQRKRLFDFSKMMTAVGEHEPGSVRPTPIDLKHDYGKEAQDAMLGQESESGHLDNSDMDKVSILWIWEPNRMFAIANGSYIVGYKERIFQSPRIPYRLKGYTPQKEFLFAIGAIEPIEPQFYELQDIHKLSMRNWIRIINRMVAYNESAIPFKDDFKPRAGGKIRVRPELGGSVADALHAIDMPDVTQSMLAQESNTKGLIERTISVADYSPGIEGTKQTHKTLGGLMEISRNIAKRTTTVRRMVLAGYQDQMWFMEKLHSQFLLDKQPFTIYGPDGSTRLSQFDLWDFDTGGLGFDFVIEYDPSFGDDALLRNQMMVLLDASIKYENARVQLSDGKLAQANLEEVMRRLYKSFGWSDTSKMLLQPNGTLDPMAEFNIMLDGQPVAPNPEEDLIKHLIEHTIQANSPKLLKGVQDGSIDPKVLALLRAHIQATQMVIASIQQNPEAIAQAKIRENIQQQTMAQRRPMPGSAGGNPEFAQGSIMAGDAARSIPINNASAVTPRSAGMPRGI